MKKGLLACFLAAVSLCSHASDFYAQANVSVQDMVLTFPSKGQRLVQQLRNTGEAPAFVKVDVLEILDPHTPNEREKALEISQVPDLVATPQRVVIPPKATRGVGLYLKKRWDKDRFFRVRFTPVRPTKEEGFVQGSNKVQTGASVGIAWGTLVVVPRANPSYQTELTQDGNIITLNNAGNSFVEIKNPKVCSDKSCSDDFDFRVMSNESQSLDTKGLKSFSASLVEGGITRQVVWNAGGKVELR